MTNESIEATPRTVRDALQKAYKETTDFDTELFNALFAALTMLEGQEARLAALESQESNLHVRRAALEAARPTATPKVLYEGEAWIVDAHPTNPTFHFNSAMLRTSSNRVHVVVTAAEDDES